MTGEAPWLIVTNKEPGHGETLLFWRPKAAGYTTRIDEAGRFTDEEVAGYCGRAGCSPSARAVRVEDVEPRAVRVVPMDAGDWGHIQAYRKAAGR